MKVMISQPMNGKTEEQIRQEREELIKKIQEDSDTYNGWDKARGCIIEHEVATSYDKTISYYKD